MLGFLKLDKEKTKIEKLIGTIVVIINRIENYFERLELPEEEWGGYTFYTQFLLLKDYIERDFSYPDGFINDLNFEVLDVFLFLCDCYHDFFTSEYVNLFPEYLGLPSVMGEYLLPSSEYIVA